MPVEFSTNATISAARSPELEDEIEQLVNVLHPRFTTLWFSDHPQNATLEAWTSATYVAARYPRFKVGTLVLAQGYRNPCLLANMAASLQLLSGGRLILGLGAGWQESDYRNRDPNAPRCNRGMKGLPRRWMLWRACCARLMGRNFVPHPPGGGD